MKHAIAAMAAILTLVSVPAYAGNHVAVKIQGIGINLSAATGATLGQFGGTVDTAPVTDKDGKPLDVSAGTCSRKTGVNTFTNMNGHAQAAATTVPNGAGITGPSIAAAAADESANGGAAIIAAAAMTANPASVIDAYCGNPTLPNAPQGSQIRPSGQ